MKSSRLEKRRYWEKRVHQLLSTLEVTDVLQMSWAIEAMRTGREAKARRVSNFPGLSKDHDLHGDYFIAPWDIEALVNERVRIEPETQTANRRPNLREWGGIAKLMGTFQGLSNIESVLDYQDKDIIPAMQRLFWPQYEWQVGFETIRRTGRAWFVYGTADAKIEFHRKYELELEKFLFISFAIYSIAARSPRVAVADLYQLGIGPSEVLKTVRIIGGSLTQQSEHARAIFKEELPRVFGRSVIRERPIFVVPENGRVTLMVPSRELLLLRITDGLYYDIVSDENARNSSGDAFEALCYRLCQHYFSDEVAVERECDTSFGKSVDLLINSDVNRIRVLADSKSRRLPQAVLSSPNPWENGEKFFDDMVKGVWQIWRTQDDLFSDNDYSSFGIVVQYDAWMVLGNHFLLEVMKKANQRADELRISESSRVPVFFASYWDFEHCLKNYDLQSISLGINAASAESKSGYELRTVIKEIGLPKTRKDQFDYDDLVADRMNWWGNLQQPVGGSI